MSKLSRVTSRTGHSSGCSRSSLPTRVAPPGSATRPSEGSPRRTTWGAAADSASPSRDGPQHAPLMRGSGSLVRQVRADAVLLGARHAFLLEVEPDLGDRAL